VTARDFAVCSLVVALTFPAVAHAQSWSSSDRWGSVDANEFTIRNDVWGSTAGPQTIWASWGNGWVYWGVWADHSNTGGIKSYPHVARWFGKNTSDIHWLGSWFGVNVPSAGAYDTSYDIWFNGRATELMIWMNKQGDVGPIGSYQATASVGGHSFDIYRGSNGSNEVISYLRTSNLYSGNVDIKAIMDDLQNRGWLYNPWLEEIQCGFEISSSSAGMVFEMQGFSLWDG
jgi:hypothetical protein